MLFNPCCKYCPCQVADAAEQQLIQHGWNVLRPDREAPHLKWVQYLNWVTEKVGILDLVTALKVFDF